ncbi:hypothetical protein JK636_06525 [Clostridium sp. YIM B02515]|uniref:Uncharacterized protein n=1 Tax=Clostridium rhizosphaerae TaxID=2803861 RepID=A0ABS1T813_9CLOT|nr:hypothetical protein [Clostridium rhizosphaerae]MBL4935411.1 hypothetical protein [Clostridium rhizosphaerae]
MKPKEELKINSNNVNSINYRPQTTNTSAESEDKGRITSRQAGNEVRNAVESFEREIVARSKFD